MAERHAALSAHGERKNPDIYININPPPEEVEKARKRWRYLQNRKKGQFSNESIEGSVPVIPAQAPAAADNTRVVEVQPQTRHELTEGATTTGDQAQTSRELMELINALDVDPSLLQNDNVRELHDMAVCLFSTASDIATHPTYRPPSGDVHPVNIRADVRSRRPTNRYADGRRHLLL